MAGFIYDATQTYTVAFVIGLAVALTGLVCVLLLKKPLHPLDAKGNE